ILQNRKVPVEEHTMQSDVEIGEDKSMTIIHYPQVTLASNASSDDKEKAEKAMHGADNACCIGKLLKNAGITIEMKPEVISKQAQANNDYIIKNRDRPSVCFFNVVYTKRTREENEIYCMIIFGGGWKEPCLKQFCRFLYLQE